jgi:hypothetical protein
MITRSTRLVTIERQDKQVSKPSLLGIYDMKCQTSDPQRYHTPPEDQPGLAGRPLTTVASAVTDRR